MVRRATTLLLVCTLISERCHEKNDVLLYIIMSPINASQLTFRLFATAYTMARFLYQLLLAVTSLVTAQNLLCPNEVALYNKNDRTMSSSSSECCAQQAQGQ
jgi:hypothetical protein